ARTEHPAGRGRPRPRGLRRRRGAARGRRDPGGRRGGRRRGDRHAQHPLRAGPGHREGRPAGAVDERRGRPPQRGRRAGRRLRVGHVRRGRDVRVHPAGARLHRLRLHDPPRHGGDAHRRGV
ncbi:MAG: hypothetical protein AVDCRST_MAG13-1285, partial [uncultured Solirubrobacteraceae bacterium]